VTLDGNPADLLKNLLGQSGLPAPLGGSTAPIQPPTLPTVPTVPKLPTLPGLPGLGGLTAALAGPSGDLDRLLFGGLL